MTFTIDEHGSWANGIGRLMLAFAGIEGASVELVWLISRGQVRESAARLQLNQRIELLLELCERSSEDTSSLEHLLKRVKSLQSTRNLVAHNPLVVEISVHPDNRFIAHEAIRSRLNANKSLTLAQLQQAAKQAEELESEAYEQVSQIHARREPAT